jgi:hypothetical protein
MICILPVCQFRTKTTLSIVVGAFGHFEAITFPDIPAINGEQAAEAQDWIS